MLGLLMIFLCPAHSSPLPDQLLGIWEGRDRYVFFEQPDPEQNPVIVIVLKTYYGWHLDRAAEPESYAQRQARSVNAATAKKAESVDIDFLPISMARNLAASSPGGGAFAGELVLIFSKLQQNRIALAVDDGKMYLNFFVQDEDDKNCWRGNASSDGIKISGQSVDRNIGCLYITPSGIFDIRYWISDMEYSPEKASAEFGGETFFVDKHLYSCGNNYSATSGRSNSIRNVVAPIPFDADSLTFSQDGRILIADSEPYLVHIAGKETFEDLMQIVRETNSRVKPPAKPPFPPSNLDYHWDLIDQLESGNLIIQEVRARQRNFGPRGKDSGR